jgi:hypothetical protein
VIEATFWFQKNKKIYNNFCQWNNTDIKISQEIIVWYENRSLWLWKTASISWIFRAGWCASKQERNPLNLFSRNSECVCVLNFPFRPNMNILKRIIPTTPTSSTMLAYLIVAFLMVTTLQADEVNIIRTTFLYTQIKFFIQSRKLSSIECRTYVHDCVVYSFLTHRTLLSRRSW